VSALPIWFNAQKEHIQNNTPITVDIMLKPLNIRIAVIIPQNITRLRSAPIIKWGRFNDRWIGRDRGSFIEILRYLISAMIELPNINTDKAITTIHIRLANSPSSPPNANIAPEAASAMTPIARAAGPLREQASSCSGASHGIPPPANATSGKRPQNVQDKNTSRYFVKERKLERVFMMTSSFKKIAVCVTQ
jgi:hypothetical protein